MIYGCNGRKPITTFGATTCQYTISLLGKDDKRCDGCSESISSPVTSEKWLTFGEQCRDNAKAIGDAIDRHLKSVTLREKSTDKGNKWSDCA